MLTGTNNLSGEDSELDPEDDQQEADAVLERADVAVPRRLATGTGT